MIGPSLFRVWAHTPDGWIPVSGHPTRARARRRARLLMRLRTDPSVRYTVRAV